MSVLHGKPVDVLFRALGEFATDAGMPTEKAQQLVNNFLMSLQVLDNTLITSLRSKVPVPDIADKQLEKTIHGLDRSAQDHTFLHVLLLMPEASNRLPQACWAFVRELARLDACLVVQ